MHSVSEKEKNNTNIRYFKLPHIGMFSDLTQTKLNSIISKYYKNVQVKLVFNSFKIRCFFSVKDSIPSLLKSRVFYQFKCESCNACYIWETSSHFQTRVFEHIRKDENSHDYKHNHNYTTDCFSILDTATSKFQLKLKEGLYIGWKNPELNKQVNHLALSIYYM